MFKKAIFSVVNNLDTINGSDYIKRLKETKTTHNWRLGNNTVDMPYKGITKDIWEINKSLIFGKDIVLVDDVYTEGVFVAEDCIQTLFDFGVKVLHYM